MESETKSSWLLYLFAGLAALIMIPQMFYFLLPPLGRVRPEACRISSRSNLKQMALAIKQYAIDYEDYSPIESGADGFKMLIDQDFLTDYSIYVFPMDKKHSRSNGHSFTEANTSYAYVGAGFKEGDFPEPGKIPRAFEKPWVDKGYMNILYLDGHVENFEKVKFKTCIDVVEFCRQKHNPDDPAWQFLLKNARLVDEANPLELRPPARRRR